MNEEFYGTGAEPSPYDVRTFAYAPSGTTQKGGKRYDPDDIEHQHKVGICTAISLTQNARKATGTKYSAEFQYLCQKKFRDGNWNEGSSASSALWVAKNIGLLPAQYWTATTEEHRKLPYHKYSAKLQAVSDAEIARLKILAAPHKIAAYAKVPVDRDLLAQAINESRAGIIARYVIGKEWWKNPIEPLRSPVQKVSGHLVTVSNYDGDSFRNANSWGAEWADWGTAYHLFSKYKPTEAWIVYYTDAPAPIQEQIDNRTALQGKLLDLLQALIKILTK